ncbi:enabled protein [Sarcoptes scabiei]|nr:enabled protein [Sarcoptes scabiei]
MNFVRFFWIVCIILLNMDLFVAEAAFELACMDKCTKSRRCKKYGSINIDQDCDKKCKRKCYKVNRFDHFKFIAGKIIFFFYSIRLKQDEDDHIRPSFFKTKSFLHISWIFFFSSLIRLNHDIYQLFFIIIFYS